MKRLSVLLCLFAGLGETAPVDASPLYASTAAGGRGELYILNPANGSVIQDVGPLNDANGTNFGVTGLAFHPVTGVLYGSTSGNTGTSLLIINPTNARVTVVGPYNFGGTMSDLAFTSSGQLYGISATGGANLYSINTISGQATEIGVSGFAFTQGGGIGISPGGIFYSTPLTQEFGTLDPTTGAYTHIANPVRPAGNTASYAALAFDGNTLYGINLGTPPHLVTFDSAGNVTDLGTTPNSIDGIAFQPPPVNATLSISFATNNIVVRWPGSASAFRLQQNTNVNTANWVANTNSVSQVNGTNQVTLPPSGSTLFFRLVYP
jgi:Repeat of unknown function (DUF6923)